MTDFALLPLAKATWETIYMVFISGFLSIVIGLALGVIVFLTGRQQALANRPIHLVLSFIVNATRSLPFIILLIAIIPFTALIVGTSIGTNAAIVPLTLAAIPFFARVAENAFSEKSEDLLETAASMGATTWQLVTKFLIPESLPSLINGATLTIIGLIGYSAMAGTVGGGGLGELAINFGYQRFNVVVMLETVVVLIVIVQLVQAFGDRLASTRKLQALGSVVVIFIGLCLVYQLWPAQSVASKIMRLGITSPVDAKILERAVTLAKQCDNINLKIVLFNDYVQPNVALDNGSLDANLFQHVPYLESQNKVHDYHILPVAKMYVYPFGFYSHTLHDLKDLKPNAKIAIPNDPSNEGRALLLLARYHVISLKPGSGLFPTLKSIADNPLHLHFVILDAAQIPRALKEVALGGLTNDYSKPAGFLPSQAVILENGDSPYANVLVVRRQDKHKAKIKKLIAILHSKILLDRTLKAYPNGAAIPAFKPVLLKCIKKAAKSPK
jgi:YaeC family lipoprotein